MKSVFEMRILLLPLACLLLLSCGCNERVLWSYRDDIYLQKYGERGEEYCRRKMTSMMEDNRILALRMLSEMSARARQRGNEPAADSLAQTVIDRYSHEHSLMVRKAIISMCAPVCGIRCEKIKAFLRRRIAEGRFTHSAVMSLAAISESGEEKYIIPLTRHPQPDIRYSAALALTVIAPESGRDAVEKIINEMKRPDWPAVIRDVSLNEARHNLELRFKRVWPNRNSYSSTGS